MAYMLPTKLRMRLEGDGVPMLDTQEEFTEGPPPPARRSLSPSHPHNTSSGMVHGISSYSVESTGRATTTPELQAKAQACGTISSVDGTFLSMSPSEKTALLEYIHLEPGKRRKLLALDIIAKRYAAKEWIPEVTLPDDPADDIEGAAAPSQSKYLSKGDQDIAPPTIGGGGASTFASSNAAPGISDGAGGDQGGGKKEKEAVTASFSLLELEQLRQAVNLSRAKVSAAATAKAGSNETAEAAADQQRDLALAVLLEELLSGRVRDACASTSTSSGNEKTTAPAAALTSTASSDAGDCAQSD